MLAYNLKSFAFTILTMNTCVYPYLFFENYTTMTWSMISYVLIGVLVGVYSLRLWIKNGNNPIVGAFIFPLIFFEDTLDSDDTTSWWDEDLRRFDYKMFASGLPLICHFLASRPKRYIYLVITTLFWPIKVIWNIFMFLVMVAKVMFIFCLLS